MAILIIKKGAPSVFMNISLCTIQLRIALIKSIFQVLLILYV